MYPPNTDKIDSSLLPYYGEAAAAAVILGINHMLHELNLGMIFAIQCSSPPHCEPTSSLAISALCVQGVLWAHQRPCDSIDGIA